MIDFSKISHVWFVGIGGIGMSALARYFLGKGIEVYGYDLTKSGLTKKLEAEGMKIHYEEDIDLDRYGGAGGFWSGLVGRI